MTIKEAAARLRAGGVVAFPTETVYGLGANALDEAAVRRVYELKGRPSTSPLIVHVASVEMAKTVAAEWPPLADELARRHWPGPLTLVLRKQPHVPDAVTAGLPTVGIRIPAHPVARELIEAAGVPLAAPSANKFTGISPTTAEHVRAAFGDEVPVIDGGPCQVGIESTVVAIDGNKLTLLRPGMVAIDAGIASREFPGGKAHPAPGMHHRHYSPRTPLYLVTSPSELRGRDGAYLWYSRPAETAHSVQMPSDPAGYAARLYSTLHEIDEMGLPWIAVERAPDSPGWEAIRDRLARAKG